MRPQGASTPKCISGQQHDAMRRIEEATMTREDEYTPWTTGWGYRTGSARVVPGM